MTIILDKTDPNVGSRRPWPGPVQPLIFTYLIKGRKGSPRGLDYLTEIDSSRILEWSL